MRHSQPASSTRTSQPPPPDRLPPGYTFVEWLGDAESEAKTWAVLDPDQCPAVMTAVTLDLRGPRAVAAYRARELSRTIPDHRNVLKYQGAWVLTADGEFVPDDQAARWPQAHWDGVELFVVMEATDRSLADRLKESRQQEPPGLPAAEVLSLVTQAARGIDHVFIHQDVNPSNLRMVGREVKVANYGGVPAEERAGKLADPGPFSTAYYAPQGWSTRQKPRPADDLYSLAVTYYELRTDTFPADGSTTGSVTAEEAREAHDSRRLLFPLVSAQEAEVLAQATAKNPPFRTCQEFVRALTAACEQARGSGVVPTPAPRQPQPGSGVVRHTAATSADSTRESPRLGAQPMSAPNDAPLTDDAERAELSTRADEFYKALARGVVGDWGPFLAGLSVRLRPAVLTELAIIEMGQRWTAGERPTVEEYLARFPELGPADRVPAKLILEEHLCRLKAGEPTDLDAYRRRFPVQYEVIEPELQVSAHQTRVSAGRPDGTVAPPSTRSRREGVLSVSQQYEFVRELGRGMFGEVWLARKKPSGIEKAIKILLQPADRDLAKRELRSLELIKNLRHPYLLATEDFWVANNRLHIAMELADKPVRARFKECQKEGLPGIPADELAGYFAEAAEGLDYLHVQKITHRDVKPDNILLLHDHAKVADFGLARHQEAIMASMSFAGTPAYMAPEVWGGEGGPASDQYSLAFAYAELRQGKVPIPPRPTMQDMMLAHLDGIFQFDPIVGEAEQAVLRKAMARMPADRYESCSAFVDELARAVGRRPSFRKSGRFAVPAERPLPSAPPVPPVAPPPAAESTDEPVVMRYAAEADTSIGPAEHTVVAKSKSAPEPDRPTQPPPSPPVVAPTPVVAPPRPSARRRPQPARSGSKVVLAGAATAALLAAVAAVVYFAFFDHRNPGPADTGVVKVEPGKPGPTPPPPLTPEEPKPNDNNPPPEEKPNPKPPPGPSRFAGALRTAFTAAQLPPPLQAFDFWRELDESRKLLAAGRLDDGLRRAAVFADAKPQLPEGDESTARAFEAVRTDLPLLWNQKDGVRLVSLQGLQQVCNRLSTFQGLMPDHGEKLQGFYRALLPLLLKRFVTHPDTTTPDNNWTQPAPWAALSKSLSGVEKVQELDQTWPTRLRAECALMVRHLGGSGAPDVSAVPPAAGETDPVLRAYAEYLAAARECSRPKEGEQAKHTDRLVAAVAAKDAGGFLNPARKRLVGQLIVNAVRTLRSNGPDYDRPYAGDPQVAQARRWLKTARELQAKDDPLAPEVRARLLLAAAFPAPDRDLVRVAAADKDSAAMLAAALTEPRDRTRFWLAYARTREDKDVGETTTGYEQVVGGLRPDADEGDLAFAKRLARDELIGPFAGRVRQHGARADKDRAARLLVRLARPIFKQRPLMIPDKPTPDMEAVIAADLAAEAAGLTTDPALTALARVFNVEAGRAGNLDARQTEAAGLLKLAPGQPATLTYLGLIKFLKIAAEKDWEKRLTLLGEARTLFRDATTADGSPDDTAALLALLYRDLAVVNTHLGNAVVFSQPAEARARLEEAADYADKLLGQVPDDPRALDVYGCVREDQAWLIKYPADERKKYFREAAGTFDRAIKGKGRGQLVRHQPLLHLGRCRYKWANTFPEDRGPEQLLEGAETNLTEVRNEGRPEDRVEANYWLALIEFTRAGLAWKKDAINGAPEDLLDPALLTRRPRLADESLKKARTHLKAAEEADEARRKAAEKEPGGAADSWFRGECTAWLACLACYQASVANTADDKNRLPARKEARTAIDDLAKLDAWAAARLRSTFLYAQLDEAIRWGAPADEKKELWQAFEEARPGPGLVPKTVQEERALLQLYVLHYKARRLQIALKVPVADDSEKAMQEILKFGKGTRIPAPEQALLLEATAWELTLKAYGGADQFDVAMLAAHAFTAAQELDPKFTFLTGDWTPVTAAQWRNSTASMLLTQLEKTPNPELYKKTVPVIDKLLGQSDQLLKGEAAKADKNQPARVKDLNDLRGRRANLPKL